MKLKITITMDNSAFEPESGTEAARILHQLAEGLDGADLANGLDAGYGLERSLLDINGNEVGEAKVTR